MRPVSRIGHARGAELAQLQLEQAADHHDIDRMNARAVTPKRHAFQPRSDGGSWGSCCVFSNEHPVHAPAEVIPLFRDRRR